MLPFLSNIHEFVTYGASFFGWRDCCEILFFTMIFYYFSVWLNTDTKKNLLLPFYSYISIAFVAYVLQLHAITLFLFFFAPAFLMLFIVIHQEVLQRNFISLKNKSPLLTVPNDWLDIVMRVCLYTINKNKEIYILIEQEDALDDIIQVPFKIDTALNQTFLTVLIESNSFNQTHFVWLSKNGNLLGINATWKQHVSNQWLDKNIQDLEQWKQQAIAITQKTDAIIFSITPLLRTFTIICQGNIFDGLQGTSALRLIKQYIVNHSNKKGFMYGYAHKNSNKQLQS